jgi:hypothetical protein
VPRCKKTSKTRPGSSQSKISLTKTKCPELEIGMNSVKPWIMPKTIDWKTFTDLILLSSNDPQDNKITRQQTIF